MVVVAIGMIVWLLRSKPAHEDKSVAAFYARQRQHRIITALFIGLVGLLIAISSQVEQLRPSIYLYTGIMVLIVLIMVMAVIDSLRIRSFFLKNDLGVSEARDELIAELKRASARQAEKEKDSQSNGPPAEGASANEDEVKPTDGSSEAQTPSGGTG